MAIDDGRVVSNFIVAALQGKDITIYGDGTQTRSFCYVDDLIYGLYRFVFESKSTGPMNIGTEFEFTMKELADLVIELTDSKSKIVYSPLPQDDPKQRKPDLNLAKKLINWQPTVSVRDGMQATIEYFKTIV